MVGAGDGPSDGGNTSSASASASDVLSSSSLPRSFSYGTDDGLEAGRQSLLGSRMNSTNSLLGSRRGSVYGSRYGFGNAYFEVDDLGVYLSSVAVTVLMACMATIGIILFTLVVTLAVMLGKCQKAPLPNTCASFTLNAEMNNLQGYLLPQECESFVANYVGSGQYHTDFTVAVEAARSYLTTIEAGDDGRDLVVLDIDETALSNMPYYIANHYGVDAWNETLWDDWVNNASAPALDAMLSLYTDLRAQNWSFAFITGRPESQREKTEQNLAAAGYSDWVTLVLRSPDEHTLTAVEYKSKYRKMLESDGYRIRSSMGDQWSDLSGGNAGDRTFKLPNPMYYIY
ncbi:hypothetical protein M758_1G054800 [Ceratodon purpureus]|uniref:Acid phosphatase n=1 Tax=Ceratodon purpureus TaxID=3225 RepID=A0A8T0J307_CERPU|nr:hypothetical protein KC19_1G057300 [Ceratodon purpureus]KAG0628816.1 hypothetical protein M758_1G054800 [Ceratodon purpureus]